MASYSSYKKIYNSESIVDGAVTDAKLAQGTRKQFGVKWIFGQPCQCSTGCCCAWVVPDNVRSINFELWGAGGGGHGACSCNRCHHYRGASGGAHNQKYVTTTPGCTYTVCAAGVYRCLGRECCACQGCTSYVNGYNLSNFCAIGGHGGLANTAWTTFCNSEWACCFDKGDQGGDFGFTGHVDAFGATVFRYNVGQCHCYHQLAFPQPAVGIGTDVQQFIGYCWIRCGCWTVPYGHGGQGAMTTYCGSGCCGQGGTGGPGLAKITYW